MKRWIVKSPGSPNDQTLDGDREAELLASARCSEKEKVNWDSQYAEHNYVNVWSMTEDTEVVTRLCRDIAPDDRAILIPGCGSKTYLKRTIANDNSTVDRVVCLDWSESALREAERSYPHERIQYVVGDASAMEFADGSFDMVLIVNAVLSKHDVLNRKVISECARILRPGGRVCGFFPTIFSALEVSMLDDKFAYWRNGIVDAYRNTFYESGQRNAQTFYTPLRLNQILKEAGLKRDVFEIFFCDTEYFQRENKRIYGFDPDSGLYVWELYVRASKPGN